MGKQIIITINGQVFSAELNDSAAAQALADSLPLTVQMSRWGDEYYGDCGLAVGTDSSARELMEVGELAYWPPGSALCIFFGPTPASTDEKPRAASAVLPLGKIIDGVERLTSFGSSVRAEIRDI